VQDLELLTAVTQHQSACELPADHRHLAGRVWMPPSDDTGGSLWGRLCPWLLQVSTCGNEMVLWMHTCESRDRLLNSLVLLFQCVCMVEALSGTDSVKPCLGKICHLHWCCSVSCEGAQCNALLHSIVTAHLICVLKVCVSCETAMLQHIKPCGMPALSLCPAMLSEQFCAACVGKHHDGTG